MSEAILFAVVAIQVLVFQFLSLRFTRALPDYLVGFENVPAETEAAVRSFKQESGRIRQGLGVLLWVLALLLAFALPTGSLAAMLALTAISLVSTVIFLAGMIHDRRTIRAIAAGLPDPGLRTARLEVGSLSGQYAPAWEGVPIGLFVATVVMTLSLLPRLAHPGGPELGLYPLIQAIFVFGTLVWSIHAARSVGALPQRSRPFLGSGPSAFATADALKRMELRFFLAAKIGVTLMLGAMQAKALVRAMGRRQPEWLDLSHWGLVVLLLGLFAAYGLRLSGVKRRVSQGRPAREDNGI